MKDLLESLDKHNIENTVDGDSVIMGKCHICGSETDYECRDCGEFVCDDCTVPYTQFSQIDYTLCTQCGGIQEDARAAILGGSLLRLLLSTSNST